ncbi:MAG: DUF3817 domain-containing protein, partial [Candidatus Binatia bacterium]
MPGDVDRQFLQRLRVLGIIEGISTLVLFGIAMPLKYAADIPLAVTVVGPVHGFLFLALATMFMLGMQRIPLSPRRAATGIVAAGFPFGPGFMDRWLGRV